MRALRRFLILALLPVFYLAVVGAFGFAMYFLATTTMIPWPHPALMWVAEAAIGLFLLGLIKALIEPQRRGEQVLPLDLPKEETLREFVAKICQQIDAPRPQTIQLECSTRMAAEKGGSVVTLGLPAIAAMSVDQFACVLAGLLSLHRPKAGCGVMNKIRAINYWLWRSVYGKSRFDDQTKPFGNTYSTPGWQRAQARWSEGKSARSTPHFIEGEMVARDTDAVKYAKGERVFHEKFGYGVISAVEGNKLTIDFDKAGEKRVIDSFVTRV